MGYTGEEPDFSPFQLNSLVIDLNTIYEHKFLRVNYTTYDLRREQDSINPRTHPDVMVLSGETAEDTDDAHPYWYARVIGIYHARVRHIGPLSKSSEPQRLEFLRVRWYVAS